LEEWTDLTDNGTRFPAEQVEVEGEGLPNVLSRASMNRALAR
jgi:hypothetical protein